MAPCHRRTESREKWIGISARRVCVRDCVCVSVHVCVARARAWVGRRNDQRTTEAGAKGGWASCAGAVSAR